MAVGVELKRLSLPSVDRRTMLGIGLAAAAALLVLVVTRPAPTVPVLVAGVDLPAGTPLSQLDVAVKNVPDAAGLVSGNELGELSEWSLRLPISKGEPLTSSILQPPNRVAAPDLMAFDVDAAHAVLGRLSPGDLVDVYVTTGGGPGTAPTTDLVASRVFIVDANVADGSGTKNRVELLLAVDSELAATLTAALHQGAIDLVQVSP